MKTKATHRGECQYCGRIQKLPKGYLAQHGYAVRWNSFQGICRGSGYQPYQESAVLIPKWMKEMEEAVKSQQVQIEHLRQFPTEPTALWTVRESGFGMQSQELPVTIVENGDRELPFSLHWKSLPGGRECSSVFRLAIGSEYLKSPLHVAHYMRLQNAKEIELYMNMNKRWLAWQQKRFDEWKPAPLLPLEDVA